MGHPNYLNGFDVTLHPRTLDAPLRWRKPRAIFVNSMSDLFHEDIPSDFIARVFDTMQQADWHVFQVLTKRSQRLAELASKLPWPENVWIGVSVETDHYYSRIDHLRLIPAGVRFLSLEPLLGPMRKLDLTRINWVIAGGESGPGARPMDGDWVREIRNQCRIMGVPFFFKQWGGVNKKQTGRRLDGKTWDQMPPVRLPIGQKVTLR